MLIFATNFRRMVLRLARQSKREDAMKPWIFIPFLLAGCMLTTKPPTAAELTYRDKAIKPPTVEMAQEAAAAAIRASLIDPQSAQFEFQPPVRSTYTSGLDRHFGWLMCGLVNSKNRFGGYVGRRPFIVAFSPNDPSSAALLRIAEEDYEFYVTGDCEAIYSEATEILTE